MQGSWTFLALIVVVVGLLVALNLWLARRGSAGASARLAAGPVVGPETGAESGAETGPEAGTDG
ncbi:hypothetical protein [Kribbia dieselivorans]|uniref:hypothetical protein n=1 Tax=Kribbia dieselivorans TaxID=331526 RepID=UPI000839442A|nr:hypothetical protein [Kribbia dieselivorans]